MSFACDPRDKILDNVSFTMPAGRTLAIVGPSGSGESTITRTILVIAHRLSTVVDANEILVLKAEEIKPETEEWASAVSN